jgi:cellulose synthase/poly-beta-1,6-N-acetylglucosamine synthase-like glycosyltransferase
MQAFSYLVVVTFLTFSALMYLIARQGALQRFSKHVRVPRAELDRHFSGTQSSITVLVPSYAEETGVIRKTLISAALQEYPGMRVVLLVDDKPNPTDPADAAHLQATRALPGDIMELFSVPHKRFSKALVHFEQKKSNLKLADFMTVLELAGHYAAAADWLNNLAGTEVMEDHVDVFFADQVLRGLATELSLVADALIASCREGVQLPTSRVHQLHRRLAWIFEA